jgi:hypothetical protein
VANDDQAAQQVIEEWAAAVADLYNNASGTHAGADERAASEAAANLWSEYGRLDAPTAMARLITQAIEVGYLTALHDIRHGRTEL